MELCLYLKILKNGIIYKPYFLILFMKNKLAYTIVRVVLGLAFIFYGVTKFFPFGNVQLPGPASAFLGAMFATGYFIPFVGICEALVGIMLVFNWWVPLAMMILSPIMVNVILFNLFLAPSLVGAIMLIVLVALQVYVMYYSWDHYKSLFTKVR